MKNKDKTIQIQIDKLAKRISDKLPKVATDTSSVKKTSFKDLVKAARQARKTFSNEDTLQSRRLSY